MREREKERGGVGGEGEGARRQTERVERKHEKNDFKRIGTF